MISLGDPTPRSSLPLFLSASLLARLMSIALRLSLTTTTDNTSTSQPQKHAQHCYRVGRATKTRNHSFVPAAIVSDTTRHPSTRCTRSVMIIVRANPTRFLGFFLHFGSCSLPCRQEADTPLVRFTNSAAWQLHARADVLIMLVSSSKKTRPATSSADDIRTNLSRGFSFARPSSRL